MDEHEARRRLADVYIESVTLNDYTHNMAAMILLQYDLRDQFHVIADERGAGPFTWTARYTSMLDVLEKLAEFGGERLRFWPDGGIEFWAIPEAERVDWGAEVKKILDASKG